MTRDTAETTLEKVWRFIEQSESQLNMVSHLHKAQSSRQEGWVVSGFPAESLSHFPAFLPAAPGDPAFQPVTEQSEAY